MENTARFLWLEESSVVAAASNPQNFGPQEVVSKQPLSIPKK
jgi:hypothetical protein